MSVNYLRISVTDRCNLRCFYCMPEEGIDLKNHSDIMSYEDIFNVTKTASKLGIDKVRITGGEPLARLNIYELIKMINSIDAINEISMTTNAVFLSEKAEKLKSNGLDRVNISLDTLDKDQYKNITGKDQFDKVIAGIKTAKRLDLKPVKINAVIIKGYNDDQIDDFIQFMDKENLVIRFIEYMPIGAGKNKDNHISLQEIKDKIDQKYSLSPIEVKGNGPAVYYKIEGFNGKLGFISPFSHNFCDNCNRLRLTSDGKIRTCLLKEEELNLYHNKKLKDSNEIKKILLKAIKNKRPHFGYEEVVNDNQKNMHSIGG
ncbi:MAG: GTP 3',8-cyclase MoaA [Bacillota bacterium]